jgi:hypothetical protein
MPILKYVWCFMFLSCLSLSSVCLWGFCLGILPVDILYFNQSNSPHYSFSPFFPYPVLFNSFQCVSLCLVPIQMWCSSLLFTLFLFFSSLSLLSPILEKCFEYIYMCIWQFFYLYWIYLPHMRENMWSLSFWTGLTPVKMMMQIKKRRITSDSSYLTSATGKIKFLINSTSKNLMQCRGTSEETRSDQEAWENPRHIEIKWRRADIWEEMIHGPKCWDGSVKMRTAK